ncbi:tRNA-splicing endonuclease subunit sen54 N-term-domain-containing protein [Cyathus striatus]|nr:tRNA-splicing endonuclease subunit sen54 N-term-domain-containing protein [Cyathus striatus]
MDDSLEAPSALPPKLPEADLAPEDDENSSGDEEDGGLDWTKLLPAASRPVIPKRGEKEFEPRGAGGTNLQLHVLERSRMAMFETLRTTRATSSKTLSYAIWYPELARAHVTITRGVHFSSMGHSAPRTVTREDGSEVVQKRLELLPEETIYLIERGSLFCYKKIGVDIENVPGLEEVPGAPISVQEAYSDMIGKEDLTLEKFQVYSYLRRLGYMITRTDPPTTYYPIPGSRPVVQSASTSIIRRMLGFIPLWGSMLTKIVFGGLNWWKPVHISKWFHHDKNYASLFRSLRFLPVGHNVQLQTPKSDPQSPYKIFYNVYKPSTPFKKSAPPQPDFQIVVINARTTLMPTIRELTDLFDVLPELPPPVPRQRRAYGTREPTAPAMPTTASTTAATNSTTPATDSAAPTFQRSARAQQASLSQTSILQRLFPRLFPTITTLQNQPRRPNPFMVLKQGKKMIVVAAVDAGNTSFFRFSQGGFEELPMA